MGHVEYWRRNAINPAWGDFYSCKRLWQVLLCNASMQLWQVDFTMARFGIIAILSSKWKNISCNRSNWKRLGEEILSVWHVLDPCAGLKILRTWFNSARLHLTQRGSPPSRNESRQHMDSFQTLQVQVLLDAESNNRKRLLPCITARKEAFLSHEVQYWQQPVLNFGEHFYCLLAVLLITKQYNGPLYELTVIYRQRHLGDGVAWIGVSIIYLVVHLYRGIVAQFVRPHNLEVPGSNPGWSTLKIK